LSETSARPTTGITSGSPALSVARTEQRLAFSLQRESYEIRQLKGSALIEGTRVPPQTTLAAARLAPASGSTSVDRFLADARRGLSGEPLAESVPFSPRLSLTFVGQEFNVSTGGTGPFLSGGIGFLFSDMLGNHVVEAMVQANNDFRDTAGRIGYMNRSGRWNWGGFYQFVPAVTGGIARGSTVINGQPVLIEQEVRDRQIGQQVQGVVEYPISRTQRFEFGTGLSHFTFNRHIRTDVFTPSGAFISRDEERSQITDPLTLWQTSAAFVTDSSVFGATGPLMGTRARFEVAPTVGGVDYTSVVLDARRYVMPFQPFTIAGRLVHVGRYGADSDSGRVSPLFVGFPTFVRGLRHLQLRSPRLRSGRVHQARRSGGQPLAGRQCRGPSAARRHVQGTDRLRPPASGSLRLLRRGHRVAGRQCAAVIVQRPSVGEEHGGGVRLNAFGFAVIELSAAHAFDRPRDKWQFLFALQPGF